MKKFLSVLALTLFSAVAAVDASNYPADYTYQTARVVVRGPAVMATVNSGIMSKLVIGYKGNGILGGRDRIQAVVRMTSVEYYSGYQKTVERVIDLPREWNGTGYMTAGLSYYDFVPQGFAGNPRRIEVAFFSGQQWDSNYNANYAVEMDEFYSSQAQFTNKRGGGPDIEIPCWDFIVAQMRK
ncbi:MAG: hypothetical protein A2X35_01445 [Elusimicrobia bacterium GWA2_61_42]|nr:MAG: hypothetical protein A2X35_01445 [Elusimicrobia bacterium GWA2_61_42]OGR76812.1 MAG: hypothetical protein A2X38_11620 [Elusimicrobia bacterium GWC2_61_25]